MPLTLFYNFMHLFSFGCSGSLMPCGLFFSYSERGLLFMAVPGLLTVVVSFCGRAWILGHMGFSGRSSCAWSLGLTGSGPVGSVVVVQGLSCSTACGLFPNQGSNPQLLHWQVGSSLLSHQAVLLKTLN